MSNLNTTKREVHIFKSKYKRKDGKTTWSYRFEMPSRNKDGKREFATKSGFLSQASAKREGTRKFDELYKGFVPETSHNDNKVSSMRFSSYVNDVWMPYKRMLIKESSMYGYKKLFKNLIFPKFEYRAIGSISTDDIHTFLNVDIYENSTISNNTYRNVRALLKQVFDYAVKNEHISKNPLTSVKLPNFRIQPNKIKKRQARQVISNEVMNQIYELYPKGTPQHLAFKMLEQMGMRVGEVFALCWSDISFTNHCVYLVRQEQRKTMSFRPNEWEQQLINRHPELEDSQWYISNPKYESRRVIPLTSEIEQLLKDELQSQLANRTKYGEKYRKYYYTRRTKPTTFNDFTSFNSQNISDETDDFENGILNQIGVDYELDFIFRRENGEHFNSGNMQYATRKIHGFEGNELISSSFNVHSLRHTFASRMRAIGLEEHILKYIMGHKEKASSTRDYLHIEETEFNQAISKINPTNNVDSILKSLSEEERKEMLNKLNNFQ